MKKTIQLLAFVLLQFQLWAQAPNISYSIPTILNLGSTISPITPNNTGGGVYLNEVSTFAGSGTFGDTNGTGTAASFRSPGYVKIDGLGNLYITDQSNNKIKKITPAGVVTTFAGSGASTSINGTGTAASFNSPGGLVIDASGNMYVAEGAGLKIRSINAAGVVTDFVGSGSFGNTNGTGAAASFFYPRGIASDASGNVYVADSFNSLIRKITPAGVVTTFAGNDNYGSSDGTGTAARFANPKDIAIDGSGNLYVADHDNHKIRKITPSGVVTTLAGSGTSGATDGTGTAASFYYPKGVAVDAIGNVYVADTQNNKIRKITPTGVVTTVAGSGTSGANDGIGTAARFNKPEGLVVDATGNIFITDSSNSKIRKITQGVFTISPTLPNGLIFDNVTGTISGTPTQVTSITTYTITATNASGSSTTTVAFATQNIPTFTPVSPICLDGTIATLPTTSNNSITGTWSPAINNAVTTTYTFTPDAGQDAGNATMVIEVLPYNCIDTQLNNISCNQTLTAITDKIYAVPFKDAEAYRFEVVANGITRAFDAPNPVFSLIQLPAGALYNTTFSIRVAPKVAGILGDYSAICTVTSPEAVTKLNALFCGNTASAINTAITCKPVYRSEGYFFEITNTNDNSVINYETKGAYFQFSNLGITPQYATTYSVRIKVKIDGNYERFGDACTVSTPSLPTTKVRATICGTTLPLLNSPITCDAVFAAEMYLFEITNNNSSVVKTIESKTNTFNLSLLSTFASYNTIYNIKVAVKIDGNYGDFGTACAITTPQLPISKIKTAICGTTVNATTLIAADAYFGAQGYRFKVTNNSDNTIQYIDNAGSYFKPSMLKTKMTFNTAYSIRVALKIAGNYGAYGNSCTVYTANARTFASESDFNVKTYPNPFDNAFNLDLESNTDEAVYVNVYDMIGKLIESRDIEKSSLNNTSFGNDYAAGIYNVIVSQGGFSKKLRVIKK